MMNNSYQSLKNVGLKNTPTRKLILDIFSNDCKPIDADFIYGKLKGQGVNKVTIYRTLASLEVVNIIKKVDLRKDSVHYELSGSHHHHIICTNCGVTEGFENCNLNNLSKEIIKKSSLFTSIDQHSFELFGKCSRCVKSN